MKILTYLMFTVLSIFIQFCVMDLIQENTFQKQIDLSKTSQKVKSSNIIRNTSDMKPHALYVNKKSNFIWNNAVVSTTNFDFTNIIGMTTDNPSSIFEFYDENSSITEFSSTDMAFTEVDNVTEITLFETKNQSSKTNAVSKTAFNKDCSCNFLYNVCDINCCCDLDCKDNEQKMFGCSGNRENIVKNENQCFHFLRPSYSGQNNIFDNLFCIVKRNLPEKRIVKQEKTTLSIVYKWNIKYKKGYHEIPKINKTTELIWILNKGSIYYLDIPTALVNNYCMDRQPIKLFYKIKSICNVKINDLEMFHVLNIFEEGVIISPNEHSVNSTVKNCLTYFCAPCNVIACVNNACVSFNKSIHEATCTDNTCTNLALKIDYIFYYYDMKIMNVTLKFHMENVSMAVPFVTQELNVDFLLSNLTDEILEFSGSPGYVVGRPIIASFEERNHTEYFYNRTSGMHLRSLFNKNGQCILYNKTNILFGINKRTKCRYIHNKAFDTANYTYLCKEIQESINNVLGLRDKISVSPYGNPFNVRDEDWVHMKKKDSFNEISGEFDTKTSKFICVNIATSISYVFAYEELENSGSKILQAEYEIVRQNKSFDPVDISTVVTIEVSFVDVTAPAVEEYASRPHFNIGLPRGFFYPFLSNKSNYYQITAFQVNCIFSLMYCVMIFFIK